MDVRIGMIQTARELDVELGDSVDRDALLSDIESALGREDGLIRLTDKRGRLYVVPTARVAYVEVGAAADDRRVGFGAP